MSTATSNAALLNVHTATTINIV